MRNTFYASTAGYIIKDGKVLMIQFKKKWGRKYAPVGGKIESGETPSECMIREIKEETGLEVIKMHLKGISYWKDSTEGFIYVFLIDEFKGEIIKDSEEGRLQWFPIEDIKNLSQFDMNQKFTPYLFKDGIFEGKFILDNETTDIIEYSIRTI